MEAASVVSAVDASSEFDEYDEWEGEGGGAGELADFSGGTPGEYQGDRNKKNERAGKGKAILPNGDEYVGCYYRGYRYGQGIYKYKSGNGANFKGDWKFGAKDGWGTMFYPDGSQYT